MNYSEKSERISKLKKKIDFKLKEKSQFVYFDKLTERQKSCLPYFLTGASVEVACKAAGINSRHYYFWKQEGNFTKAIQEAQKDMLQEAKHRLLSLMDSATDVLVQALENSDDKNKLRACEIIFDQADKLTNKLDLVSRIEALEQAKK